MLYNDYRPLRFQDVIGQPSVDLLKRQSTRGRYGHTYLFFGQSGSGKTTSARILAMALNCKDKVDGEPCGQCQSCRMVSKGIHWDVIEIDAAKFRGIDDIKELNRKAYLCPTGGADSYKIYIIDEAHQITLDGFNAMLKLLEEPPDHLIIILCTTKREAIPDTIASRCQLFPFVEIKPADIAKRILELARLEGVNLDNSHITRISQMACGNMRQAETMLEQTLCMV